MKQYLRIFSMLLLMLIGIGGGDVFGAEETVTFDATKDKGSLTSGGVDKVEKSDITVSTTNGMFGNGSQYRSYKDSKLTVSSTDKTITKIVFTCTADSYGPAKASTKTGTYNCSGINGTWTGASTSIEFSCSAQIRMTKIEVTYQSESMTATTTTFGSGIDNQTFKVKKGEESSFTTKTAILTPSEAGSLKYSSNNETAISVDENTGEVTFKSLGTATITAAFAGSSTHVTSSASYTIDYYDPNMIVFSDEYGSFDKIGGNGYQTGDKTFVDQNGIEYTFNLNRSYKNNNGLQMEKNNGKVISPAIKTTFGYKLIVETKTNQVTISFGDLKTTTTSGHGELSITNSSASFTIEAGSSYAVVSKIQIIPFTKPQKKEAVVTFPEASYTNFPGESFTAPTASVKNAEGEDISDAKVTYSISGDDIATIDANTGAVTPKSDALGTATITATFAGDANYKEATGSYTLNSVKLYSNIKDLRENVTDGEILALTLNNAKVLAVKGSNVYIRDNQGAICFYNTGIKFANNDDVNGTIKGEFTIYKGLPQLKGTTNTNATGLTITAGKPATPKDLTIGDFKDYDCDLVSIKKGTAGKDGTNTIVMNSSANFAQFFDKFSTSFASPYEDAVVDVTGIVIPYQASTTDPITYQICPLNKYDIIYHFDEAEDNAVGAAADVKVQLTRTLSKEYWNTFCVPFSMTAEQIAATFGEGTKVTEYDTTDGTTLNFTEATEITAGVPYLIKPAATTANPSIEGVTIATGDAKKEGSTDYKFIGIYSPKALATDGTELFIGTDSKLYIPAAETNTINGMRAYLNVPAGTEGARLNILGEMVTAIDGVSLNRNDEVKVFNLKGQRVGNTTKGLTKGIYVVNGKKMVINK